MVHHFDLPSFYDFRGKVTLSKLNAAGSLSGSVSVKGFGSVCTSGKA